MRRGGRGEPSRSGGSSLCVLSSGCGRPESPAPNDAQFFYFSTAGAPVRAAEVSPVGVLMAAWTPNATRWRWILAFVSWGISLYRFCPLCWGKKAHRSGSTIGNSRGEVTPVPQRTSARFTTSCLLHHQHDCLSSLSAHLAPVWWPLTTRSNRRW